MIRKIKKAKYNDLNETTAVLTFEDDTTAVHQIDDVMREHTSSYLTFLKDGGVVEAFETDAEKAEREAKEAATKAKEERAILLQKGSLSKDGKIWFNFDSASMFIQAFSTLDEDETLPWYDKDKNEVFLTYTEAKMYAKEIRVALQSLYGLSS